MHFVLCNHLQFNYMTISYLIKNTINKKNDRRDAAHDWDELFDKLIQLIFRKRLLVEIDSDIEIGPGLTHTDTQKEVSHISTRRSEVDLSSFDEESVCKWSPGFLDRAVDLNVSNGTKNRSDIIQTSWDFSEIRTSDLRSIEKKARN